VRPFAVVIRRSEKPLGIPPWRKVCTTIGRRSWVIMSHEQLCIEPVEVNSVIDECEAIDS
jgi:hypothetical protein